MKTLPVHLFKNGFGPFVSLLNEHGVKYQMLERRINVPLASSGTLEIVNAVGNAAMWGSLAAVVVAFIKARSGRKVMITTEDGLVIQADGITAAELEKILLKASQLSVIDPMSDATGL